jgi:hypothetical protein
MRIKKSKVIWQNMKPSSIDMQLDEKRRLRSTVSAGPK